MSNAGLIFKMSCPDAVGLVAKATGLVAARGLNLAEAHSYSDSMAGWFFLRLHIESEAGQGDSARLEEDFARFAGECRAEWTLRRTERPMRMVILASRETHCVTDLLWRRKFGELFMEVPLVISNHRECEAICATEGIPFRYVPFDGADREAAFRQIARECESVDGVIMARFMQILPPWFCEEFRGRVINIHHSFLPAFAGADPYRQAFERGVKLIGATCHYATEELDAGPIIDQEVVRAEHFHDLADLRRLGRDCERLALARGVRYHIEDRVLLHGAKTVVFRD